MRTALALALVTLLGCAKASTDATEPPIVDGPAVVAPGTYTLSSVNGRPVPAVYFSGVIIKSARLTVLPAGTWTEARTDSTGGRLQSTTYFGTWVQAGSDIQFRVGPTPFYTGQSTSSGLRLSSGGTDFAYSRE